MTTIKARQLYTGRNLEQNATIQWEKDTITSVTSDAEAQGGMTYEVVTPAIIDAHCHIGLIRGGEPGDEAEANEEMDAILAHADVLDSVQMDDAGFRDSIEMGVLYSCVLPGSGNIISGQSAVIRNYASTTNQAFIRQAGIKAAIGYNPTAVHEWKGTRPYTRMGAMAMLRSSLHDVRLKMAKLAATPDNEDVTFDAQEEVFRALLAGETRLRVHVHKADDIAALLRLVDTFGLKITVDHTCDVHQEGIYEELAYRGIPVIFGPLDSLAYKVELRHENWRNLGYLIDSGVKFGLMTDHPVILQRNLLLTLRWFLRLGLSKQAALEIITRSNAEILGIDDLVGTIEPQKWASLICWNGDPFSLGSYPVAVYAEGELVFSEED